MERRHIFRQYCRRTFSSDMARFPASSLLPNVSRTRDDEIANLRACNRITQPIDMMREWKRSDKAVNSNYNSACSNQPAPDVPSSRSDKAPDQAVIRLESSRWSDSEERTNDVMNCRNIDTAFGHVAEKILRGFPQWYPRNSANSFLEVLKRLPFDMNLPMVASTSADSQSVTACSRTPPDRLVALNNPDQLQLSDRSDSRCGRLCDINEIVCSTSRSFDNLSSMLQDCGSQTLAVRRKSSRRKRSHLSSREQSSISSLESRWASETNDDLVGRTVAAKASHTCDCEEAATSQHRLPSIRNTYLEPTVPAIAQPVIHGGEKAGTVNFQMPTPICVENERSISSNVTQYLDEIDTSLLTSPVVVPRSADVRKNFSRDSPSFNEEFRYYHRRMF